MFEARIAEASILKKVLDAIKDLIKEGSFDCTDAGVQLQAMDSSHVSLISLNLWKSGFENYRCDRDLSMGMNLEALGKIMKCANNDDIMSIRARDGEGEPKVVTVLFEPKQPDPEEEDSDDEKEKKSKKKKGPLTSGDRVSEFDMKLMILDGERLGIPETEYDCSIKMSAGEFAKIIRDLSQFGESITISCTKHGVQFSAAGDIGTGNIKVAQSFHADDQDRNVSVSIQEPSTLTFASKYLVCFAKAAGLSNTVTLSLSHNAPLTVEFKVISKETAIGYLRYYLAPKIDDDD